MKVYSITFQTVLHALQRQWKRILITVLLFALLGAGGGILFQGRGMAEAGGSAQPLPPVDYAQVPRTRDYYTDCLALLTDTMTNLNSYIASVSTNAAPAAGGEAGMERLDALDALERDAAVLQSGRLVPLRSALSEAGAVYAPAEYLDSLADRYAQELETLRMDLIAAEAAAETIRQMDSPDYDGNFTGSYNALLSQALQYGTLLRSQAVTEKYLDRLTNHMPEIRTECRRVERELRTAAEELNALMNRFIPLAGEIAREANLTFTPAVKDGKTEITVTHSHRASSAGESFAVIFVFCVLVGICFGVFLAVCREAKEETKRLSSSAEASDVSP